MLNRIRDRFGTAGLVVSIMALVLALAGGAFAASGGLTAKQKKQVKAIAKSFQGTGPTGAAGANGAQGPAGAPGLDGLKGATGATGATGDTGTTGDTGSPWTAGGTLPVGETLKGFWSVRGINTVGLTTTGSFAIPTPTTPTFNYVQCSNFSCTPTVNCPSTAPGTPTATAGNLCVYGRPLTNLNAGPPSASVQPYGFLIEFGLTNTAVEAQTTGTWAVKA